MPGTCEEEAILILSLAAAKVSAVPIPPGARHLGQESQKSWLPLLHYQPHAMSETGYSSLDVEEKQCLCEPTAPGLCGSHLREGGKAPSVMLLY